MKNQNYLLVLIASFFVVSCNQAPAPIGVMDFTEGVVQHVVKANEIQWKPCPPNLPDNCEMIVLEGNPKSDDMFTVRFRISGEFIMPAHTHPKDERVTVLNGNAYVAFGKGATKEEASAFGPGDYYVNARNEIHTVWADSATVIQITGIGPWEAHFVE